MTPIICIIADIRGLSNTSQLEQLNKRYWYVCQDYTEYKYPHQPKRFPEIMMCLPEIRCIAGKTFEPLGRCSVIQCHGFVRSCRSAHRQLDNSLVFFKMLHLSSRCTSCAWVRLALFWSNQITQDVWITWVYTSAYTKDISGVDGPSMWPKTHSHN